MLRTILIDDEKPCLERLSYWLQQRCADMVQIVGQYQTIGESLNAIEDLKPDLVFLDVELKLDGDRICFDLLGGVRQIDFSVIFATAFEQYAMRAFEVDAIDYLKKPIDADKLVKAVRKVQDRSPLERTYHQQQVEQAVLDKASHKIGRIGIPMRNGRGFIHVNDIVTARAMAIIQNYMGSVRTKIYPTYWVLSHIRSLNLSRNWLIPTSTAFMIRT